MNNDLSGTPSLLAPADIDHLIALLREDGYRVHGPVARDGTVRFEEITSSGELARGARLEQGPGVSRLAPTGDDRFFGTVVGPESARRFLIPPRARVLTTRIRGGAGSASAWEPTPEPPDSTPIALLGLRACDLAAIAVQDRVYHRGPAPDATYASHRERLFLVAVECGESAATCFCASVGTGPAVSADPAVPSGADLVLTEILDGPHRFVARADSDRGRDLLDRLGPTGATAADETAAAKVTDRAAGQQTRRLRPDAREVLADAAEHPHWQDVATRCLTCANCTLVCPTCFCTTVTDHTDLTGEVAERWRRWDSCFTEAFSHTSGGSVRTSAASRYRQWLTHKLCTWVDQFDTGGCVGCGRCIAWCPVGIDLTAEVDAIAAGAGGPR